MRNKIQAVFVILFFLIIVFIILYLVIQNNDYKNGIDGRTIIHGTYGLSYEDPELDITIVIDSASKSYIIYKGHKSKISNGKIKINKNNNCELIDENENVNGKLISSYKKIYYVDIELNIFDLEKQSNSLTYNLTE